jgi:hypothetical protein
VASGDTINRTGGSITILLLDAATTGGTSNGIWCEVPDGYAWGTVVVTGAATTTVVSVNALNDSPAVTPPSAAIVGAVVTAGAAATASFTSFPVLPRWVKCAITAAGTGTVTAVLQARRAT